MASCQNKTGEQKSKCRLCATDTTECSDLKTVRSLVLKYVGVEITDGDELPTKICFECESQLISFDEFVEKCLTVQARLSEYASQSIKQEEDKFCNFDGLVKQEELIVEDSNFRIKQDDNNDSDNSYNLEGNVTILHNDSDSSIEIKLKSKLQKSSVKKKEKKSDPKIKKSSVKKKKKKSDPELEKYIRCDQCPKILKSLYNLKIHMWTHLPKSERALDCPVCDKKFHSKGGFNAHKKLHIRPTERFIYPCSVCGKKYTSETRVLNHTRAVHEKIKMFVCDTCGYACSTRGELVGHRATHSDERRFECNICLKRFKLKSTLRVHIDTHAQTSYPCTICSKVLNSRKTWRNHLLVHQDVCKYKCSFCDKVFKRKPALQAHTRTHTGDKPFQCPWCPKRFAFTSSFCVHKHQMHYAQMAALNIEKTTKANNLKVSLEK